MRRDDGVQDGSIVHKPRSLTFIFVTFVHIKSPSFSFLRNMFISDVLGFCCRSDFICLQQKTFDFCTRHVPEADFWGRVESTGVLWYLWTWCRPRLGLKQAVWEET